MSGVVEHVVEMLNSGEPDGKDQTADRLGVAAGRKVLCNGESALVLRASWTRTDWSGTLPCTARGNQQQIQRSCTGAFYACRLVSMLPHSGCLFQVNTQLSS